MGSPALFHSNAYCDADLDKILSLLYFLRLLFYQIGFEMTDKANTI